MRNFVQFMIVCVMLFALSAIPASAQAHSVSLSMGAVATPGIAGYNFYRAPTAAGPFVKLNPAPVTTATNTVVFTDSTVQAGSSYVYNATSICPAAGCGGGISGESVASNNVSAVIPTDKPTAPSGLTITNVQ